MFNSAKKMLVAVILTALLSFAINVPAYAVGIYTVKSGDTLWKISSTNGLTVTQLKQYNALTSDTIYVGQKLTLLPAVKYTVKNGDTLWLIAQRYGTTVDKIVNHNNLTSTGIYPSQVLYIPSAASPAKPAPVLNWPSVTYTVKAGDYVSVVASKFGVPQADILKYNYMTPDQWLDEGEKIAINGYAPRNYDVMPGESSSPARVGKLVDWFLDGRYLIKRNDVFLITDVQTGLQFKVKMLGGINHSDVETLTANDTLAMKKLFPTWVWKPRAVVIFHDGINFAASLSGMPHSFDTISDNNVTGHFDLYLYHSIAHSASTDPTYEKQHQDCVLVAAGMK
jgi:LysM repeat protein